MILIDDRVGSRELLPLILRAGVQAELGGKLATDFQFEGNGPDGGVLVGFERKTIQDLISSMREKRLAGNQVGPMMAAYDICYVVVEGVWRIGNQTGMVEIPRDGGFRPAHGAVRFSEMARFLASLRELGGLRIWRTHDAQETAHYIVQEWHWWQKQWDDHKTHRTLYSPDPKRKVRSFFRSQAPLKEHWLSRLPGIDARAEDLAKYFTSARDLANSTADRWQTIKGIGKKTAEAVVAEMNKET